MQARLSFKYALRHKIVISDKSLQYFIVGFHILIVGKVFRYLQLQDLFCYYILHVFVININNMSTVVYFC